MIPLRLLASIATVSFILLNRLVTIVPMLVISRRVSSLSFRMTTIRSCRMIVSFTLTGIQGSFRTSAIQICVNHLVTPGRLLYGIAQREMFKMTLLTLLTTRCISVPQDLFAQVRSAPGSVRCIRGVVPTIVKCEQTRVAEQVTPSRSCRREIFSFGSFGHVRQGIEGLQFQRHEAPPCRGCFLGSSWPSTRLVVRRTWRMQRSTACLCILLALIRRLYLAVDHWIQCLRDICIRM